MKILVIGDDSRSFLSVIRSFGRKGSNHRKPPHNLLYLTLFHRLIASQPVIGLCGGRRRYPGTNSDGLALPL